MRLTTEGDSHDQKKKRNFGVFFLDLKLRNKESTKCLKICWKKKQMNQAECLII